MPDITLLEILILRYKRLDQIFYSQNFVIMPLGNVGIDPVTACETIESATVGGFVCNAIPAFEIAFLQAL